MISILVFSLKNIATPELLEMVPEFQMDFPFHSFFHFPTDSGIECVFVGKQYLFFY